MANTKVTSAVIADGAITPSKIASGDFNFSDNLGLGTSSPVNLSGQTSLTINGSVARVDLQVSQTTTASIVSESGYVHLQPASGGKAIIGNGTTDLVVNSSGNVGIGTTSPSNTLTLSSGTNDGRQLKLYGTSNNALIKFDNADTAQEYSMGLNASAFIVYDDTNSAYRLTLDSSGNFGIGTSSPASGVGSPLTLTSTSTGYVGLRLNGTGSYANDWDLYASGDGAGLDYFGIYDRTNTAYRMVVTNTGNVGINQTSPSQKLEVVGKIVATEGITTFAGDPTNYGLFRSGTAMQLKGASTMQIESGSGSPIVLYTNGGYERMRIQNDGGVSVSNDGQMGYSGSKFHVKGTAFTTSDSSGNNTGGFSTFSGYKSVSNSATTLFTLNRSNGAHSGIIIITKSEAGDSASTIYSFAANYAQTVDIDILSSATAGYTGFTLSASMDGGQTLTVKLTHGAVGSKNYTYTVLYGGSAQSTTPTLY